MATARPPLRVPPLARHDQAEDLLRLADAPGLLLASITGPGGSGKSVLLAALAERLHGAGVRTAETAGADVPPGGAVLVDDAHLLVDDELDALTRLAHAGTHHLVVAHRPGPGRSHLDRVLAAMGTRRRRVVLGPVGLAEVARYAEEVLGVALPAEAVAELHRATAGLPWLMHRVAEAWEHGRLPVPVVPPEVATRLGVELDHLEPATQELLLALAVGFDLSGPVLPPAVLEHGSAVVDAARDEGLLARGATGVPLVGAAVLAGTDPHLQHALRHRLVETVVEAGRPIGSTLARDLADAGVRHPALAHALLGAGDDLVSDRPEEAAGLYRAAAAAGAGEDLTAARRARAAAAAGDTEAASRLVDDLLSRPEPPVLAVDVAAAVWARRGMLVRSAEAYRWLGPRVGSSAPVAAVTMLGTGDLDGAESLLAGVVGSPTTVGVATRLMAEGLRCSVVGSPTRALALLLRASDTLSSAAAPPPLPELPAVLAALVALQNAEAPLAGTVLDDALRAGQGGAAVRPHLLLVRSWTAMLRDQPAPARAALAEAREHRLDGRDRCLALTLDVGLARRADDAAALVRAWSAAREQLLRCPSDLFTIQALAELHVCAARLRDTEILEPHLTDAWALLERLGRPAHWAVPLHWGAVQAAILADRPQDLRPHAAAVVAAAPTNRLAAALAPAGRAWVRVLARSFDAAEVEEAAEGLARAGMVWEGARLVGHAAARADDRREQGRLLARARAMHPVRATVPEAAPAAGPTGAPAAGPGVGSSGGGPTRIDHRLARTARHPVDVRPVDVRPVDVRPVDAAPPTPGGPPRAAPPPTGAGGGGVSTLLSDREREVAAMVLAGRTYRDIGETLYISPRTAEHHVARIRRRLGAQSRSDLLVRLRAELGGGG
ncbi:LuxR C-terminal-related transcriptional regulator [Georgenia sp. M64]|uniref:helix-turn-helix transcriptional regulator n=1 Tax=Georgenia sp. M64 TaxID=3120520 RepID=UPI0030E0E21E